MNMLTNKTPYGLLEGEDLEAFRKIKFVDVDAYYEGSWICWDDVLDSKKRDVAVRLRLKEGEWYNSSEDGVFKCKDASEGARTFLSDDLYFRPATQDEIDAVQPKVDKFIDVEIEWFKNGGEVAIPTGGFAQIDELRRYFPIGGCVFIGFFFRGTRAVNPFPIIVDDYNEYSSFEVKKKAEFARFVIMGDKLND